MEPPYDSLERYITQWQLTNYLNPNLLRSLRIVRMPKGREIIRHTDPKLYFLVEGSAHVSYEHAHGKQSLVGTIQPLALIGELDLFYTPDLRLSIITQQPSIMLSISREEALTYGADDPRFLRLVIHNLSEKLTNSTFILKHKMLPLIGQIAAYLLSRGRTNGAVLEIPSKGTLAELMATTPRHLNRVLNTLVEDAIITIEHSRVTIHDVSALEKLAQM
jgi:CRP/FNR family transcriptional regulator, putaive post-exponential-phase nitrogen-starvation regulator